MYSRTPELLKDLGTLYLAGVIGQVMIFQILEREGPLSLSIYTGTRKILSIFISIFWFEKHITLLQKFSLSLGIFVMLFELLDKGVFDFKKKKTVKDSESSQELTNGNTSGFETDTTNKGKAD